MNRESATAGLIVFERSARRDLRFWGLFLIGLIFTYGGFTIDPASNCGGNGECAPWLVPLAGAMGIAGTLGGLSQLLSNPSRGSRLDVVGNRLDWWQNRVQGHPGDCGSIALDQIARIRIKHGSDADEISLYGRSGERLAFFDSEVVPTNLDAWADAVRSRVPTIGLEIAN